MRGTFGVRVDWKVRLECATNFLRLLFNTYDIFVTVSFRVKTFSMTILLINLDNREATTQYNIILVRDVGSASVQTKMVCKKSEEPNQTSLDTSGFVSILLKIALISDHCIRKFDVRLHIHTPWKKGAPYLIVQIADRATRK